MSRVDELTITWRVTIGDENESESYLVHSASVLGAIEEALQQGGKIFRRLFPHGMPFPGAMMRGDMLELKVEFVVEDTLKIVGKVLSKRVVESETADDVAKGNSIVRHALSDVEGDE